MNRDDIIDYLKKCDLVEFGHIVSIVVAERKDTSCSGEPGFDEQVLLSVVGRMDEDDGSKSAWEFSLVAQADPDIYDETWKITNGEPFLQAGFCNTCKLQLASHAKNVICPICSSKTYAT